MSQLGSGAGRPAGRVSGCDEVTCATNLWESFDPPTNPSNYSFLRAPSKVVRQCLFVYEYKGEGGGLGSAESVAWTNLSPTTVWRSFHSQISIRDEDQISPTHVTMTRRISYFHILTVSIELALLQARSVFHAAWPEQQAAVIFSQSLFFSESDLSNPQ